MDQAMPTLVGGDVLGEFVGPVPKDGSSRTGLTGGGTSKNRGRSLGAVEESGTKKVHRNKAWRP